MNTFSSAELFERCLEYAAENIEDLHQPLLERFYQRIPDAKSLFSKHDRPSSRLEDEVIEQALYCLMNWYRRPAEIEILLQETVPHHIETLDIPLSYFLGLLDTLIELIAAAVPQGAVEEHKILSELLSDLGAVINGAASTRH